MSHTQRNLFKTLLNHTEIRLYIPLSDWFGYIRASVWCQINRKMVNIIWFLFDLQRFRKYFFACSSLLPGNNTHLENQRPRLLTGYFTLLSHAAFSAENCRNCYVAKKCMVSKLSNISIPNSNRTNWRHD